MLSPVFVMPSPARYPPQVLLLTQGVKAAVQIHLVAAARMVLRSSSFSSSASGSGSGRARVQPNTNGRQRSSSSQKVS